MCTQKSILLLNNINNNCVYNYFTGIHEYRNINKNYEIYNYQK